MLISGGDNRRIVRSAFMVQILWDWTGLRRDSS